MENYMEKLKKINGSGQCAFVLAIAEKIMQYEELKIESEVYNFAKKAIEVYWYWLNNEITLDYNDIYSTLSGNIGDLDYNEKIYSIIGKDVKEEDFFSYCRELLHKYGHNTIYNKYNLILDIFYILALHVQGKGIEYYDLDTEVYEIGDEFIQDFIEKTLKQKIINEYELHLLLDYLNQKHSSYCEICKDDIITTMKNKNKMFIEKGYKLRNYRRVNASGQCAFALMIAEKVLNCEKLDETETLYQFAEEKIAYCWKWLNGEIKGKENIEKVIYTEDENKNIYLSRCWHKEDEKNQLYAIVCNAIDIVEERAILPYDEYNSMDRGLYIQMSEPIKRNIITEEEYNNLMDYLDNTYPNYPVISKKEIMGLLEKTEI